MDLQQMRDFLNAVQQERFETKVLNAILACFEQISMVKNALVETQEKMNEIIEEINGANENAEALNPEIEEDSQEEAPIEPDPAVDSAEVEEVE